MPSVHRQNTGNAINVIKQNIRLVILWILLVSLCFYGHFLGKTFTILDLMMDGWSQNQCRSYKNIKDASLKSCVGEYLTKNSIFQLNSCTVQIPYWGRRGPEETRSSSDPSALWSSRLIWGQRKKQNEILHKKIIDKLDSSPRVLFPWKLFLCSSEEQVKLLAPSQIVSPQSPIRKKRFRSCSGSKRDPTHNVLTRSWRQTSSHAVTPILYNGNLSFN